MFHKKNKQRQISGVYDVQTDTGYADVGWGTNTGYQTAGYDVRGPSQNKVIDFPQRVYSHVANDRTLPEIIIDPLNVRSLVAPSAYMCMNMMGNVRERIMDMMK